MATSEGTGLGDRAAATRREFARGLASFGVAGGLARALEPAVLDAGSGDVPVVYAYARNDPSDPSSLVPRKKWVPSDWYESVKGAFRLRNSLLDAGLEGLVGSFVVPGGYDDGTASVSIDGTSDGVRGRVRDATSGVDAPGVDVDVRVLDEPPTQPERADPGGQREAVTPEAGVPGGLYCGSGTSGGTLGPAMYASNGGGDPTPYFVTANHLYGPGGAVRSEHVGDPLVLRGREDEPRIGTVERGYPNEDVVCARPTNGYRPASRIAGAEPSLVAGQFTRWGLADLRARDEPLTKIGAFSGRTTGQIQGVAGITYYVGDVPKGGQLKWGDESSMTDGDSGSVAYHPDPGSPDEQLLVAGFNSARTWWPGDNYTWGTAAYHVRERYGLHF
jgi:hypothetical protein